MRNPEPPRFGPIFNPKEVIKGAKVVAQEITKYKVLETLNNLLNSKHSKQIRSCEREERFINLPLQNRRMVGNQRTFISHQLQDDVPISRIKGTFVDAEIINNRDELNITELQNKGFLPVVTDAYEGIKDTVLRRPGKEPNFTFSVETKDVNQITKKQKSNKTKAQTNLINKKLKEIKKTFKMEGFQKENVRVVDHPNFARINFFKKQTKTRFYQEEPNEFVIPNTLYYGTTTSLAYNFGSFLGFTFIALVFSFLIRFLIKKVYDFYIICKKFINKN